MDPDSFEPPSFAKSFTKQRNVQRQRDYPDKNGYDEHEGQDGSQPRKPGICRTSRIIDYPDYEENEGKDKSKEACYGHINADH